MIINNQIMDEDNSKKELECEKVEKPKKQITTFEYNNYMEKINHYRLIIELNDKINNKLYIKAYVSLLKKDIKTIQKNIKIVNNKIENSIIIDDNNFFDEYGNILCD